MTLTLSSIITKMTTSGAMLPVVATDACAVAGRTYLAYKRGGVHEARERLIEETTGSVVWLGGVAALLKIGNKIIEKITGCEGSFDVGRDIVRKPFENFIKFKRPKFSAKAVSVLKATNVVGSILLADFFISCIVPKINHAITNSSLKKEKALKSSENSEITSVQKSKPDVKSQKEEDAKEQNFKGNPSFGSAAGMAMNQFTNFIEQNAVGKLLSTDAGLVSGRMYNARNKEERIEIGIRDIGSIYFYMWAQNHLIKLLNKIQTGKTTRLDPESTKILTEYVTSLIPENGMNIEEFKKMMFGEGQVPSLDGLNFETEKPGFFDKLFNGNKKPLQAINLDEFLKTVKDNEVKELAKKMSELQPSAMGERIIARNQIEDVYRGGKLNHPEFLDKLFDKATDGQHKNAFVYCSHADLYALKERVCDYVKNVLNSAKDGKITKELFEKAKSHNLKINGINLTAGFAFAGISIGFLVPKLQYFVTKKMTGKDGFPGIDEEFQKTSNKIPAKQK